MDTSSNRWQAVLLADRKGYRVLRNGDVESPHGVIRKFSPAQKYFFFTIKKPKSQEMLHVMVHQLAAFQKFGAEKLSDPNIHVRHLNGNSQDNSWSNIAIGTASDNIMDRAQGDRRRASLHASKAMMRSDWDVIDADRNAGMSYKQLRAKHGVSLGTLSYRYSTSGRRRRQTRR